MRNLVRKGDPMSKERDDTMDGNDAVLARLAELPAPELDPFVSTRIHKRARAVFARQHTGERPWLVRLSRVYGRLEPLYVGAVAVAQLVWALQEASRLYQ